MSIKSQQMNDEQVIIISVISPVKVPDDASGILEAVTSFKSEVGTPVYRVLDYTEANLSFSDMMVGMASERGQSGGYADPEVRTIFVGSGELVEMGVKALQDQPQYSATNIERLFTSMDEALAYVRSQSDA